MRFVFGCLSAAVVAAAVLTVSPATADAKPQCRPNGHLHYGASDSMSTKKSARRDAIASWVSFVDLEYGSAWANFKNARYKSISCRNQEAGWSCNVEANPCRAGNRRSARK